MEGINAAFTVRGEFIHAFGDPFRPIKKGRPKADDAESAILRAAKAKAEEIKNSAYAFRFSVGKRNPQIRANQIHHIQHILDVPEAICLANDQLDLILGKAPEHLTENQQAKVAMIAENNERLYRDPCDV